MYIYIRKYTIIKLINLIINLAIYIFWFKLFQLGVRRLVFLWAKQRSNRACLLLVGYIYIYIDTHIYWL